MFRLQVPFDPAQAPDAVAAEPIFAGNEQARRILVAEDVEINREILVRLLNEGLASAQTLCETAESHDSLDQLRRTAHRVKGSTGTLGMTAVYRSAAEIEEAAVDGRMATSAMSRLRDEIAATRSALHASGFRV